MVSVRHLEYLATRISELNEKGIPGALVECGVWKGGCSMWMLHCQKGHSMTRKMFLYDTFEGMTSPSSQKDAQEAKNIFDRIEKGEYKRDYDKWHIETKWAYAPIDLVKRNIESVGYDPSLIEYVKGDVLETLQKTVPDSIAVLRLDTDWYESTKKELEILVPKVSKGGYIIVDDYYAWLGSKVATDEFLKLNTNVEIQTRDNTGGVLVLKKI
jgi:O-methyltransferase